MAEAGPSSRLVPGMLFLVVGPSSVGKDSLIDGARTALADNMDFVFPQRTITRARNAGGEVHRAVSEDEFAREAAAGRFALSWRAYGLDYGVPATIADDLAEGRSVIVNVSRGVLDAARQQFGDLRVVSVCASEQTLLTRLADRGRERADDIQERIQRAASYAVSGPDVIEIFNDGPLEEAIARFTAILHRSG